MDIQRVSCSEEEEKGQWKKKAGEQVQSEEEEVGFGDFDAFDAFNQQPNDSNASSSSRSPSTVTATTFEDDDKEEEEVKPKGPLKIKIKAAKMSGSGGCSATVPVSLGAFALAPPPGSNRTKKSAAAAIAIHPPAPSTAVAAPAPAVPALTATMDLLDFGFDDVTTGATTTTAAGNPIADHQHEGNPFGSPAVPCKALVEEEDPFAAL